jgi:hypothetical protein
VEQFRYLGTNRTNQNSVQEEIKSRLESFGEEYIDFQLAVQKYKDQHTHTTINLPVFYMGVKLGRSH